MSDQIKNPFTGKSIIKGKKTFNDLVTYGLLNKDGSLTEEGHKLKKDLTNSDKKFSLFEYIASKSESQRKESPKNLKKSPKKKSPKNLKKSPKKKSPINIPILKSLIPKKFTQKEPVKLDVKNPLIIEEEIPKVKFLDDKYDGEIFLIEEKERKIEKNETLFTSKDVSIFYEETDKYYTRKMEKEDKQEEIIQTNRELEMIIKSMQSFCIDKLEKFSENMFNLDVGELSSYAKNEFYNPELMETIMCITDSIFYLLQQNDNSRINIKFRQWLRNLRKIGSISKSGDAFTASLIENSNDLFVVKTGKTSSTNESLIHELFVGRFGTNLLRHIIPNFVYMYGMIQCSPPIINSETNKLVSWCSTPGGSNYLLMENISPSVSLREYVRSSSNDFVSSYLQVLLALRTANIQISFTHYDLHDENVLMREVSFDNFTSSQNLTMSTPISLNKKFQIPFETINGTEYFITDRVATIIDYGFSHIKFEEKHYGKWTMPYFAVYPNRSFILYDAYKLLCFCMETMNKVNRETGQSYNRKGYLEAAKILKFFNSSETPEEVLFRQSAHYYMSPYTIRVLMKNIDDLILHIRTVYDCSSFLGSFNPNIPILACNKDQLVLDNQKPCTPENQIIRDIGLEQMHEPEDIFEFCELATKYIKNNNMEKLKKIKNSFDTVYAYTHAIEYFNQLNKELNSINLMKISLPNVTKLSDNLEASFEILSNPIFFSSYRRSVYNIAEFIDRVISMKTIAETYQCVAKVYNYDYEIDVGNGLMGRVHNELLRVSPYIKSIFDDINTIYILNHQHPKILSSIILKNKSYEWYIRGLQNMSIFTYLFP
jgi:hypothetical protein